MFDKIGLYKNFFVSNLKKYRFLVLGEGFNILFLKLSV